MSFEIVLNWVLIFVGLFFNLLTIVLYFLGIILVIRLLRYYKIKITKLKGGLKK